MKHIPNLITLMRVLGTVVLVFIEPFSGLFFIIYFICGISDVLDGIIARKMNLVSKKGQILDSIADFFMVIVLLFIFVLNFKFPLLIIYWVIIIAVIRLTSLGIGFMRYKQLAFLHTYANKLTGMILFCSPFMYIGLGLYTTTVLACCIASISALEELIINAVSKKLHRDIKCIFSVLKGRGI
ncbi:CDP-alcohol phosphatidyltransferase family protein [Clostridium sp.]|uniref:CDP-alcohol phosphatidyltransferase family protein n=1 Tax=Clostridium sp. TaxID=1506 RepID=UPI0025C60C42|nr:CDP-alcohol phosphatidyltransferase family protein [Clostridium sp.]MCI1716753.1 CDP-alcohol phosphatidyltransferase family protein [Clostridium sp.]MCI1801063.1 CDP-alcohol phosphatidyltransferase family protein [Clostridium sp.]MCI1814939.1 CDP-alcohol phosphatidyltransferase family protein [Clostridium sp.]MCI2200388.1 CDP-alcohol phosphatidyltransferase family protein [Clostridium sp.]